GSGDRGDGSVIVVIGTDAPLDARNLRRLAARSMLGLGRTGAAASNGSGDYAIAFSTAAEVRVRTEAPAREVKLLSNDAMSPLFLAAIEATEEAVYNSLFRATTVTGQGRTVEALPLDRTLEVLRRHGAVAPPQPVPCKGAGSRGASAQSAAWGRRPRNETGFSLSAMHFSSKLGCLVRFYRSWPIVPQQSSQPGCGAVPPAAFVSSTEPGANVY